VLLADFGIARARDDSAGLTATGMVLASVAYAAPETLTGKDVDGRADVYSLGCSLYRMLTAKTPFAGPMAAAVMSHLSMPAPRVTEHVESLPEAINAVIAKAMAKQPANCYQTAHELADAAREALSETQSAPVKSAQRHHPVTPPFQGHQPPVQQHPPPPASRDVSTYPSGYYVAHAVGGSASADAVTPQGVRQQYRTKSFSHAHGTTDVKSAPRAVAALGPGDGDAVLALGVQPVAIGASGGQNCPAGKKESSRGRARVHRRCGGGSRQRWRPRSGVKVRT
jgi:eukaryotic-like serine/threonine-protein kinase